MNPSAAGRELELVVIAPRGLEELVADEVRAATAAAGDGGEVTVGRATVEVRASLETAYRLCLWSRVAERVLLVVGRFEGDDADALYAGARAIAWEDHVAPAATIAVRFTGRSRGITNTQFGGVRTKDAVCDRLLELRGRRPSVARRDPDVGIHVHLAGRQFTVSVDLAGEALHRRGYRQDGGPAPLKENLAAAILLLAGWPEAAREGRPLLDPMCGAGTLPIEAALIAADTAPGLLRSRFAFEHWPGHDAVSWARLMGEAASRDRRATAAPGALPPIVGNDLDEEAVARAEAAAAAALVAPLVHFEHRELSRAEPPGERGVLVANPPYGVRLGERRAVEVLHTALGDVLKQRFGGWTAHVLAGDKGLAGAIGLRPVARATIHNGALECRLLTFPIEASASAPARSPDSGATASATDTATAESSEGPFKNRLAKRLKHLRRWARREGVTCFRVYDGDLPEYAVAVDLYERWAHVQEYQPPPDVPPRKANARLREVMLAVPEVLGVRPEDVYLKVRARQRGSAQYGRLNDRGDLHEVQEAGHRFLVNFTDRVDTGLFLDSRGTRALAASLVQASAGKRFLNLFAYTGAATVYAAAAGASATTSVDLSEAYLDRARRNLELNGMLAPSGRGSLPHELVRADCLDWLRRCRARFDVILLDPPTFSTSARMRTTLEVQRDHVPLLNDAARCLGEGGVIVFQVHRKGFRLDEPALEGFDVEDVAQATASPDFERSNRHHGVWLLRPRRRQRTYARPRASRK